MNSWMDELTMDLIPPQYQPLAQSLGINIMVRLVERHGGEVMYIPKGDGFFRNLRNKLIRDEFTGYNLKELARRFNLTPRHVQDICRDMPMAGQISLDDLEDEGQMNLEEPLL